MNKWNTLKRLKFYDNSKYPAINSKVWVETEHGIYPAKYEKWDWSSSSESPNFYGEGFKVWDVLAWHPFTDTQPERSKREDSQQCEMRCSEHCGNTVRDK